MAKSHPEQHHRLSVTGSASSLGRKSAGSVFIAALILLGLGLFFKSTTGAMAPDPSTLAQPALVAAPVAAVKDTNSDKYRAIGEYLAQRFRVSADLATSIVAKVYDAGHEFKLDPLLILAVIAVESRFNPAAESTMGAKGLMQVIPRFHPEKFREVGGEQSVFDTRANIRVGARILKDYIRRSGDLMGGLQMYVGASSEDTENGYSDKVVQERERLLAVVSQHQTRGRATKRHPAEKPAAAI
jgi:Transglycosylase SLT domain